MEYEKYKDSGTVDSLIHELNRVKWYLIEEERIKVNAVLDSYVRKNNCMGCQKDERREWSETREHTCGIEKYIKKD